MALRHSPLSLAEIVRDVPVYRYLGESLTVEAVKDTVRLDIATLRAGGELIDYRTRSKDGEYAYYLDDSSNIPVDTSGLNMGLLMPLLDFKGRSQTEVFAQIGVRKALEAGQSGADAQRPTARRPLLTTVPQGQFTPVVATAIQHGDLISMCYQSLNESAPSQRLIKPLALEVHGGEFYMRAIKYEMEGDEHRSRHIHPETPLRTYKVARMLSCDLVQADAAPRADGAFVAVSEDFAPGESTSGECVEKNKCTLAVDAHGGGKASLLAPITVVFAVRAGTCVPLVDRSEPCEWDGASQTVRPLVATGHAKANLAEAHHVEAHKALAKQSAASLPQPYSLPESCPSPERYSSPVWRYYLLRDVNRLSFLEECGFYGRDLRVVAPVDYARDVQQRCEHAARIVSAPAQPHPTATNITADTTSTVHPVPQDATGGTSSRTTNSMPQMQSQAAPPTQAVDASVPRRESYFTYLLRHGPTTLKELATHFSLVPLMVRRELRDLFTTEIVVDGQPQALYDLVMPPWEEGQPIDDTWVIEARRNTAWGDDPGSYPVASFTLAEVISLLGAIDSLLAVAVGDHQRALLDMRAVFVQAARTSGYGDAIWEPPTARFAPAIANSIFAAIEQRNAIIISYWQAHPQGGATYRQEHIHPFAIDPAINPLLVAANERGELRTFRLDRISDVTPTDEYAKKMQVRTWSTSYRVTPKHFTGTPVQLVCSPGARWLREELPEARMEVDAENHQLVISVTVHNLQWLRTLLVRLGADCIALQPESVCRQLAPALSAIAHTYSGGEP